MLVDDDYPTIQFLTAVIDWEKIGMEVISTHENGQQALEYAKKETPDILITDIGMPKMDGIELTKKLKNMKDNIQVAIISCHNEFSYAQQAVKLGVHDYILKESLDPDDLQEILITCKKRLDNDNSKVAQVEKLEHKVKMNDKIDNQKLLRQCIDGSTNQLLELFDRTMHYIPVYFYINSYYQVKRDFILEDTLQFAVHNIIDEMIESQSSQKMYCIHYQDNKGFLFLQHNFSIKHDMFKELHDLLHQLQMAINQFLDIQISFLIGHQVDINHLKEELELLLRCEMQVFYLNSNVIQKRNNNKRLYGCVQKMFDEDQEVAIPFKQAVFQRDISRFHRLLNQWIDDCKSKQYHPKVVREWFLRLILDVNMKLRTTSYSLSNDDVEILQEEIFLVDTIYEIRDWVLGYTQKRLEDSQQQLKNNYHRDVLRACYYVLNHLEHKLSLDEVADHLYLNASYFSRLFKKEMQMTFVEYVKQKKIERAKELLELTDMSVGGICEQLGYDNQSYFIKVFKQICGCTPLVYRGAKWNGVKAK
ncbi:AraC family transcriptional regulator [Gracilibacillus halophilus YIM-C55.5]|uniref:AraC family transcriptional regulator n=2 Tax=Gracilibacillus TaxID=74385 RepID=N4WJR8_9BACI|nr:AraC family transcriptional regulator [Gracilibacillus halophilus YIM-C55.5]